MLWNPISSLFPSRRDIDMYAEQMVCVPPVLLHKPKLLPGLYARNPLYSPSVIARP